MSKIWLCMRNDFLQSPLYGSINSPAIEKVPVVLGLRPSAERRFKIIHFFQYIDKDLAEEMNQHLAQSSPMRLGETIAHGWAKNKPTLLATSRGIDGLDYDRYSIGDKLGLVLEWSQANEGAFPYHPASIIVADILYEVLKSALVQAAPSLEDQAEPICRDLLTGLADVGVVIYEANYLLWEIAEVVRCDSKLLEIVRGSSDAAALKALSDLPLYREFLGKYGHLGEIDPYYRRWSEDSGYLLAAIRGYLRPEARGPKSMADYAADRARALHKVRQAVHGRSWGKFESLATFVQKFIAQREEQHSVLLEAIASLRRLALAIAGDLSSTRGVFGDSDLIFFLTIEELERVDRASKATLVRMQAQTREVREHFLASQDLIPPPVVEEGKEEAEGVPRLHDLEPPRIIHGLGASPGVAIGPVKVIIRLSQEFGRISPGDIVVTPYAAQELVLLLPKVGAIVTDEGGVTCHAANMARVYAVPAVLGTHVATAVLKEGMHVQVDGDQGVVRIVQGLDSGNENHLTE